MDRFELPWPARVYAVVFGIVWLVIASYAFAAELAAHSLGALAAGLFVVAGAFVTFRWVTLSVDVTNGRMTVRNIVRTHRLSRSDVEDFVVDTRGSDKWSPTLYAQRPDGRLLAMNVFSVRYGGGLTKRRRDDRLSRLRGWLSSTSSRPAPPVGGD